jgi:hypothetical protein
MCTKPAKTNQYSIEHSSLIQQKTGQKLPPLEREYKLKSVKELVEFFQRPEFNPHLNKEPMGQYYALEAGIGRANWIFRGQYDATWDLSASAFRMGAFSDLPHNVFDLYQNVATNIFRKELLALHYFVTTANKCGLYIPVSYIAPEYWARILNLFSQSKSSLQYQLSFTELTQGEKDLLDSREYTETLALAQHHGNQTRLLDWSHSPDIACFYAAYMPKEKQTDERKNFAVYAIDTSRLPETGIEILQPRTCNNLFMYNQKGLFTYITLKKTLEYHNKHMKFPSLESLLSESMPPIITKIIIPSTEANKLLIMLANKGIHPSSLEPSLNNATKHQKYLREITNTTQCTKTFLSDFK